MSKKLVHDYTFTPASNQIVIPDLISLERFLLITNAKSNEPMFTFNSQTLGMANFSQDYENRTTTLTLDKNCSSMTDSDKLQIFYEVDGNLIQPVESYTDPVSKLRVSNPQNLIDTDFEYGLQSSKWETIELVKNIPTFFSRDGDTGLSISSISVTNGSKEVTVILTNPHNFSVGAPVIVIGTDDSKANGAFVVRSIPTEESFTFVAKQTLTFTGSINNTGTQIYFGSIYQGTEFKLDGIEPISTDGDSNASAVSGSRLTVKTKDITKFEVDTSFYLTNSLGEKVNTFNAANVQARNATSLGTGDGGANQYFAFAADSSLEGHRRGDGVQPYAWLGVGDQSNYPGGTVFQNSDNGSGYIGDATAQYFLPEEITLDQSQNLITFSKAHNLKNFETYYLDVGLGNRLGDVTGPGKGFGTAIDNNYNGVFTILVMSTTSIKLSTQCPFYYTPPSVWSFSSNTVVDKGYQRVMFTPAYRIRYNGSRMELYWQKGYAGSFIYGTYTGSYSYNDYKNYGRAPYWTAFNSSTDRQPVVHVRTDNSGTGDVAGNLGSDFHSWGAGTAGGPHLPPSGSKGGLPTTCLKWAQGDGTTTYVEGGGWWGVYNRTGYYLTYMTLYNQAEGGSVQTNSNTVFVSATASTQGQSFLLPVQKQEDWNYIYKQNHGFNSGQTFILDSADGGDALTALARTQYETDVYAASANRASKINKIDQNSFELSHPAPDVTDDRWWKGVIGYRPTNTAGSASLSLLPPLSPQGTTNTDGTHGRNNGDLNAFSIPMPLHKLAEGEAAKYDRNGGTVVGGLVDGTTYYINAKDEDNIRLGSNPFTIYPEAYNKVTSTQYDPNLHYHRADYITSYGNGTARFKHPTSGQGAMGFQDGDLIQYREYGTPIDGLVNGAFYYYQKAYSGSGTSKIADSFVLKYYSGNASASFSGVAWDADNANNAGNVAIYTNYNNTNSPIGDFRHVSIQALTSVGTGTQKINNTAAGANDGVYNIAIADSDGKTYTLNAGSEIPKRTFSVTARTEVNTKDNTFKSLRHGLVTGTPLEYAISSPGTVFGGGTAGNTYYAINMGKDYFQLASTSNNALAGTVLSIDSSGGSAIDGTHQFTAAAVSGQSIGDGTISVTAGNPVVTGLSTLFTSKFSPGDELNLVIPDSSNTFDLTGVTNATELFTVADATASGSNLQTGDVITFGSTGSIPTGITANRLYYIGGIGGNNFYVYPDYAKAVIGGGDYVSISDDGSGTISCTRPYAKLQSYNTNIIKFVNNATSIELRTAIDSSEIAAGTTSGLEYTVNSSFLMRADGFALHRPYDGGVELIPSTNPDAQIIRQTRKYFRYQSGKGIQNSLAINFNPAVDIDTFSADSSVGLVTTRENHRLSTGLNITFKGATVVTGTNLYNRSYSVKTIPTDNTFTVKFDQILTLDSSHAGCITEETITQSLTGASGVVRLGTDSSNTLTLRDVTGNFAVGDSAGHSIYGLTGSVSGTLYQHPKAKIIGPASTPAGGIITYNVDKWTNSKTRAGLFDDQNGLFWEFDGENLAAVVRSSTQQISGTCSATFGSATLIGANTKWNSQLSVGNNIVIKGQTYRVVNISSNTNMTVLPSYRGVSNGKIIVTKTTDNRVAQDQWNLDKADGKGPTGYVLDKTKIQMAYIDYSWYGAGKVRFGFKDQNGDVKYVHAFIHNNQRTEAYMRSGNVPGRYEIENTGKPSWVPALAHWGTSIIMDGRFDDDKAYIFTASGSTITQTGQAALPSQQMRAYTTNSYYFDDGWRWYRMPRALEIETPSSLFSSVTEGQIITGANLPGGTTNARRANYHNDWLEDFLPNGSAPYQAGVYCATTSQGADAAVRNLLCIDETPSGTTASYSGYTIGTAATVAITSSYPLVSIRLAPSVDTNTPGLLGEKEIINRMQLALKSVGILTTHAVEVQLRLNSALDNNDWKRVTVPSLSQLVYHKSTDTVTGGNTIFSFRAGGGTGTASRTPILTEQDLSGISDMGNSILGGDNVFPDGPDIITVTATLTEDVSTVNNSNPWQLSGRISWAESQA